MQQPGGGGGGGGASQSQSQSQSHYVSAEEMTTPAAPSMAGEAAAAADPAQLVESASPISSRPPASAAINLDELMTLSGAAAAEDAADRGGGGGDGGGIGGSGGNRWPRQETLALLKIRSEMDTAFRDATLKGPLWEDVSRKLAELGYKRSAKKCKEKFENVHKYYKRTKEGRAGRQDGKSYKFFTELEALHGTTANVSASPPVHHATHTAANPVSVGFGSISNPMPISSFRMSPGIPSSQPATMGMFATDFGTATVTTTAATAPATATTAAPMGMSFSSNSTSSSPGSDDDDDLEGEPSNTGVSRKRKRVSSRGGSSSTRKMMEFFEILMKQVMQKQEAMQQRFLEVIEKREQDRTIREEAWKRQEIARLTREHELMTQERAISASRDAAIIAFLQKITGQTIQLPPPVNVHSAPPPPVPPSVATATPLQPPPPPHHQQQIHQQVQQQQQHQVLPHHQQSQSAQGLTRHHQQPSNISTEVVMAVPEQQLPPQEINASGGGSFEPTSSSSSSRWPKAEVLALIKLRSGLESRYQEAGPKGPLWEEISGGMQRMGYKRSSKRCKEKWENINKYFKKVKESNKQRPEDAKTCPYFHELDALYRKRILGGGGGGGSSSSLGNQNRSQLGQPQVQPPQQENPKLDSATNPQDRSTTTSQVQPSHVAAPQTQPTVATESENKNGDHSTNAEASNPALPASLFGERAEEAAKKPEDIVKELMGQQEHDHHQNQQQRPQQLVVDDYDRIEEADSDINLDQDEDMEDEDEEDDEEMENERKMGYKIEFQKQNTTGPSNGGGNGAPSFLAMVQ